MQIKTDADNCRSVIQGYAEFNNGMRDYWFYKSLTFESGKLYALISEYQEGCMYLSYLLGGRIVFQDGLAVYIDGKESSHTLLRNMSWNLEPSYEPYKNKVVRKSIEKALDSCNVNESFEEIVRAFYLTEARYDRKLMHLSGERWKASAALGYALGKRIFYAPYCPSNFYRQMKESNLFKCLKYLTMHDCLVVLPVGSDAFLKDYADRCVYVEQGEYSEK